MPPTTGYGPRGLDEGTPNSARLYDYYLGGAHNFACDRELAATILDQAPLTRDGARDNRAFLQRAVRYLVAQGVEQFLDLGSGIPTVGNVHEIAQAAAPEARVVYVDYEPVAYEAGRDLLAGNTRATVVHADLRDPQAVLGHPETLSMLDFGKPVAVLIVGVLLFVPDEDDIAGVVASYLDTLVPGSYVALSHTSVDEAAPDVRAAVERIQAGYQHATEHFHVRSREEIASWFAGAELVDPGLVALADWRPDHQVTDAEHHVGFGFAGVGRIG